RPSAGKSRVELMILSDRDNKCWSDYRARDSSEAIQKPASASMEEFGHPPLGFDTRIGLGLPDRDRGGWARWRRRHGVIRWGSTARDCRWNTSSWRCRSGGGWTDI